MSSFNFPVAVDHLPINPILISKLKKSNLLSSKKILNLSVPELQRIAKISPYEANIIFQAVSVAELKSSEIDAFSMLNSSRRDYLPFRFLKSKNVGGVYTGTITEIFGESGIGKTQLCLLFSLYGLLPKRLGGLASKVVYIHSEGEFPIERYKEISESFKRKNLTREELERGLNLTDNLILKKVYNLKETIHVLQNGIPELLQRKKSPKVIIIDSVAALLRGEYDSLTVRNEMIQQLAVELWKIAHVYQMVVICVNQVSGSMQKSNDTSSVVSTDIPSLGLLWGNVLTTRLKLYRKMKQGESVIRAFEVVYSAYHPRLIINFVITEDGVETMSEYLI